MTTPLLIPNSRANHSTELFFAYHGQRITGNFA
jgi:hypothetical protein